MGTTIIIGLASGIIASVVGRSGFALTLVLGIAGALGAIFLGRKVGWYPAGDGTALIEAAASAAVVPVIGRLFLGLANMSYMDG